MISILGRRNDWWITGKSNEGSVFKVARDELCCVNENLNMRRIQLIVGPRRVGKSTVMHQSIDHLLKSGIDPKRILFFSCDDPNLFDGKINIGNIIDCYTNDFLHESVNNLDDKIFIFIDEIHKQLDWQMWLKSYYDPGYKIKFIVSGSSASHLFDGSKESLLGRTDIIRMLPMGFFQFCKFWAVYKNADKINEFTNLIPDLEFYENPGEYFNMVHEKEWVWDNYKPYVNQALQEFILIGGYPEYFSEIDLRLWQKRLVNDIIGQGLYRDIISIHKIKSPDKLEKLLFFISDNIGKDFNMKTIADTIGCDNETVSNYLTYLSQAYMTIILNIYTSNTGKILRRNKKLYLADTGPANAMLRFTSIDETRAGKLVENICIRDAFNVCENNFWSLYYWKEKDNEVDIIIDRKTDIIPVEVKYRNNIKPIDFTRFKHAFPNKKIPISVVITKDLLKKTDDVLYIPFWLI